MQRSMYSMTGSDPCTYENVHRAQLQTWPGGPAQGPERRRSSQSILIRWSSSESGLATKRFQVRGQGREGGTRPANGGGAHLRHLRPELLWRRRSPTHDRPHHPPAALLSLRASYCTSPEQATGDERVGPSTDIAARRGPGWPARRLPGRRRGTAQRGPSTSSAVAPTATPCAASQPCGTISANMAGARLERARVVSASICWVSTMRRFTSMKATSRPT